MKMVIELSNKDVLDAIKEHVSANIKFPMEVSKVRIKRVDGGMNIDPTFEAIVEIDVSDTPQPYLNLPHYNVGQRGE